MTLSSIIAMNHSEKLDIFETTPEEAERMRRNDMVINLYKDMFGQDAAISLSRKFSTAHEIILAMRREIYDMDTLAIMAYNALAHSQECECRELPDGRGIACSLCKAQAKAEEMPF